MINKLVEGALKVRAMILLAVVGVLFFGIYEYQRMPVEAFPDISPVMVPVFAEAHGMAPEEVERLVVEAKRLGLTERDVLLGIPRLLPMSQMQ